MVTSEQLRPLVPDPGYARTSSVARALELIGDRWSLLILGAAFEGVNRFDGWCQGIGIASNILSSRLSRLIKAGCLRRTPGRGRRREYRLTDMGLSLYPVALMFWRFDRLWSAEQTAWPRILHHVTCGRTMMPIMVCGGCRKALDAREVSFRAGPGAAMEPVSSRGASRRTRVHASTTEPALPVLFGESIEYLGDRWSQLTLASLFLGLRRFEEIRAQWGMATNVLADRLKLLTEHQVLQRRLYSGSPPRYEYLLTPKGRDVYPIIVGLMQWGDRWLDDGSGPPMILRHEPCGRTLEAFVVCSRCDQVLEPHAVTFDPAGGVRPAP